MRRGQASGWLFSRLVQLRCGVKPQQATRFVGTTGNNQRSRRAQLAPRSTQSGTTLRKQRPVLARANPRLVEAQQRLLSRLQGDKARVGGRQLDSGMSVNIEAWKKGAVAAHSSAKEARIERENRLFGGLTQLRHASSVQQQAADEGKSDSVPVTKPLKEYTLVKHEAIPTHITEEMKEKERKEQRRRTWTWELAVQNLKHPRLHRMCKRELNEEHWRDDAPLQPEIPPGWDLYHQDGSALWKMVRSSDDGDVLTLISFLETKDPEATYQLDTGERREMQHFTYHIFHQHAVRGDVPASDATKAAATSTQTAEATSADQHSTGSGPRDGIIKNPSLEQRKPGAIVAEYIITCVDGEMVLDGIAFHRTQQEMRDAMQETTRAALRRRDARYRGPPMNELDEDFLDEVVEWLEGKGVHAALATLVENMGHYLEQREYEHWIKLMKDFAEY